jgi:hypothetical protein
MFSTFFRRRFFSSHAAHTSDSDTRALREATCVDENVSYRIATAPSRTIGMELECGSDGVCTVLDIRDNAQSVIRENVHVGDLLIEWNEKPITCTEFNRLFKPHDTEPNCYQLRNRHRAMQADHGVRLRFLHRG